MQGFTQTRLLRWEDKSVISMLETFISETFPSSARLVRWEQPRKPGCHQETERRPTTQICQSPAEQLTHNMTVCQINNLQNAKYRTWRLLSDDDIWSCRFVFMCSSYKGETSDYNSFWSYQSGNRQRQPIVFSFPQSRETTQDRLHLFTSPFITLLLPFFTSPLTWLFFFCWIEFSFQSYSICSTVRHFHCQGNKSTILFRGQI